MKDWPGVKGYEDFLKKVVTTSLHMFDQKMYVTPAEKHSLVKTISFCIYLMDTERSNINVLLKKELPRLDQIFSTVQYVPPFGDMQTYPFDSVIKKSKNFDPSNWPKSMAARSNQDFHTQVPISYYYSQHWLLKPWIKRPRWV